MIISEVFLVLWCIKKCASFLVITLYDIKWRQSCILKRPFWFFFWNRIRFYDTHYMYIMYMHINYVPNLVAFLSNKKFNEVQNNSWIICRFYEIPRNRKKGNNLLISWSMSFIFCMYIAYIVCKIWSSLKYIEVWAGLKIIITFEFRKLYNNSEQGQ